MDTSRALKTILMAAVVSAGVVACGDGSGGLPDPHYLLRGAVAGAGDVSSAHIEMTSSGVVAGLPVQNMSADVVAPKGSAAGASVGTVESVGVRVNFVERKGVLYSRGQDGKYAPVQQIHGAGTLPHPSTLLDPDHGLAHTLADLKNVVTEVREDHDGTLAFRVTGDLPAADVGAWLPGVHADKRIAVWFAATGRHQPLGTRLTVPGSTPASIDFTLSNLNRKVQVPQVV
ncbi:LppX_LprAFG lipoprotein [Nocardia jiangxiensis]|uniref:LppX_LprAFG lipoprotein n=1 Tax=Nocardia jiangxiensis TaxID=282685 RepID=A0ABW6S4B8_9NOCA|nr:LppX_LprAFG lipoprotein [Nocardia jiangxiensis]